MNGAFFRGCQACADGKKKADNPHAAGTPEHALWHRGWLDEFRRLPPALQASRRDAAEVQEDGHADQ